MKKMTCRTHLGLVEKSGKNDILTMQIYYYICFALPANLVEKWRNPASW